MTYRTLLTLPERLWRRFSGAVHTWTPQQVRLRLPAATLLAAATAATAGWTVVTLTNETAVTQAGQEALETARRTIPALLTYDHTTVEEQLPAHYDALTGDFRDEFRTLAEEQIIPTAKDRHTVTTAQIVESGLVLATPEHVTVLMFVNQTTTNSESPDPRLDGSRIRVHLINEPAGWQISGIEPI
ncbi:hypothetical protein [Nocardia higoensis]|uniref:hypothetical protein n=1 Tax=Nocardia higoensis TaxID=228599 RepID=UPI0002FCBCE7|nr:hypothetical protein [Nocardia higoensis]